MPSLRKILPTSYTFSKPPTIAALEIELGGDAQIHVHVEGVVMGDEGTGVRAAREGVEHGGLHLEEPLAVQIFADGGDDSCCA